MKLACSLALAAVLVAVTSPAFAELRWLACKVTDQRGQTQNFSLVFDDRRNTAGLWDGVSVIEGTETVVTFQAFRSRFPQFAVTYNRNNGALSMTPIGANYGGLLNGECRRAPPPPGVPANQR